MTRQNSFTIAERRSSRFLTLGCLLAFTMAEILISLTIIGVIAAITLPSLKANINEKAWATQKKAFFSRMSQAIAMMPNLSGYGSYAGTWDNNAVTVTQDTAAASFITNGLAKELNINNICTVDKGATAAAARDELKKCGIPPKYTKWNDTEKLDFPTKLSEFNKSFITNEIPDLYPINPQKNVDTRVGGFTTINGESVSVLYNPQCVDKDIIFVSNNVGNNDFSNIRHFLPYFCANFIFDLNGLKGPNQIGKDMGFITVLYPTNPEVIMFKSYKPVISETMNNYEAKRNFCTEKGMRMATIEEGIVASINMNLLNTFVGSAQPGNFAGVNYTAPMVSNFSFLFDYNYSGPVKCFEKAHSFKY